MNALEKAKLIQSIKPKVAVLPGTAVARQKEIEQRILDKKKLDAELKAMADAWWQEKVTQLSNCL